MARRCFCISLSTLIAVLGFLGSQCDGKGPRNVTVIPGIHFLHVLWEPPEMNQTQTIESYRVRVYPEKQDEQRRVHWVPADGPLRENIACLEPNTDYVIQVFARFSKRSNVSDGDSEVVRESTLPAVEEHFLTKAWQQRTYVFTGAVLVAVVFLILTPFIWCCCHRATCCLRRRRKLRLNNPDCKVEKNRKKKKSKESTLPSAKELQEKERFPDSEASHSTDPFQATSRKLKPLDVSTTNPRSPLMYSPPSSYYRSNHHSLSMPPDEAPDRPPKPWANQNYAQDDYPFDPEEPEYVNNLFGPGSDVQYNTEMPIYGNCQF